MHIWQACWGLDRRLYLWAENSRLAETPAGPGTDSFHPFCASAEDLRAVCELVEFEPDGEANIELEVPSNEGKPQFSLQATHSTTVDNPSCWEVAAVYFETLSTISFLTSLPHEPPKGMRYGDSFLFWLESTKFLLELLARGRFVPDLRNDEGSYFADWQLNVNAPKDASKLESLSRSMPLAAGCLYTNSFSGENTLHLLLHFLSSSGRTLIRYFLNARSEFDLDLLSSKLDLQAPGAQAVAAWIEALKSRDGVIDDRSHEIARLEQRLRRWNRLTTPQSQEQVHVAFTITPPASEDLTAWELTFRLQSKGDEAKFLTAEQVWRHERGFLENSQLTPEDSEVLLLKGLGRAATIFPPLQRTLKQAFPTKATLEVEEAYEFLRNASPNLERQDFVVRYPDWWDTPSRQLGVALEADTPALSTGGESRDPVIGMDQLLSFSWKVAVGGTELSIEEFKQLVSAKEPLVRIRGQWVEMRSKEISSALEFLSSQENERLTLGEALRLGFGLDGERTGLPVVKFDARGWLTKLLSAHASEVEDVEQPARFEGELRPYQHRGMSWLHFLDCIGCGGCLADDMGLGKTIQLLALLELEREQVVALGKEKQPTLLIVPMSILDNWLREAERFSPNLRVYTHHGPDRLTGEFFSKRVEGVDLVLTTYSLAARDEALLATVNWRRMALDEAQNIKNLSTKQTQAVRRLSRDQLSRPRKDAPFSRFALTGTPLENRLEELWSVMDFLNPGYLGTLDTFRRTFAVPIERYRDEERAKQLQQVINPFVLRRVKTDKSVIEDLPEKIEMQVLTSLSSEQASLYRSVLDDMLPEVDRASGIKRKGLVLSTITKLKQICNHPALFLKEEGLGEAARSGKVARLEELLEVILAEGDRVLLFTQYAQMGSLLKNHLQDSFATEVLFMHGGVPQKSRQRMVDSFQSPNGPKIFILSLKVGGFGLNLTAANQIIHFDQWWNPAVEEQATDRAFRIGQKQNVQVRKFLCRGTLEERIAEMLDQKRNLADKIVSSTKSIITQLSTEELEQMLSLSADLLSEQASALEEANV